MNIRYIITSLVFFILQSCSISAQEKSVIGDWYIVDGEEYFEISYREDKRVYVYYVETGNLRPNYYKIENDSLYTKVLKSETKYVSVGKIRIEKNKVRITDDDGFYYLEQVESNITLSKFLDGLFEEKTYIEAFIERKKTHTYD